MEMHLGVTSVQIGKYCILPGDPGRCATIASHLENSVFIGQNREFALYSGYLSGQKVTVCSTGIGGPSAAIALEELVNCGAHTFIRVGTCGGISLVAQAGHVVIASGAVRLDGTSAAYAPLAFPAIGDFTVTAALKESGEALQIPHHVGIVQSKDGFYCQNTDARSPMKSHLLDQWEICKNMGVLASEMEASTLFVAGSALGVRVGACFTVAWNQERVNAGLENLPCDSSEQAISMAIGGLKRLIAREK